MADRFHKKIADLMLSHKRRARYVAVLVCSALVVAMGVSIALTQQGQAKTHEETVLDCQYGGDGAHSHDESCYDADGVLVCPLEEREWHVHDDSCYASETYLACGLEEGDGAHAHDESCYDEEGELACGLDESAGHVHTDECWQTDTWLACDKEEVAEEHVHGDACFKTIIVEDGGDEPEGEPVANAAAEPEDTDGAEKSDDAEDDSMPAQEFKGELKAIDEDGNEYVYLTVGVKAPKGAFAEGTTLKIKGVEYEDVADKVADAIKAKAGDQAEVKSLDSVEIAFLDKDGNEVKPAKKVEVKITGSAVRDTEAPALVLIDKDGNAEVVDNAAKVNADEDDYTVGNEDTMKLDADKPGAYIVADVEYVIDEAEVEAEEPELITTEDDEELEPQPVELEATDWASYDVTVVCPPEANVPADAELQVTEVAEDSEEYAAWLADASAVLGSDAGFARVLKLAIVAGEEEVAPEAAVSVTVRVPQRLEGDEAVAASDVVAMRLVKRELTAIGAPVTDLEDGWQGVTFDADELSATVLAGAKGLAELERLTVRHGAFTIRLTCDEALLPEGAKLTCVAADELSEEDTGAFFGAYVKERGENLISMLRGIDQVKLAVVDAEGNEVEGIDQAYLAVTKAAVGGNVDEFAAFVGADAATAIDLSRAATEENPGAEIAKLGDGTLVMMSAYVANNAESVSEPSLGL